MTDLSGRYEVRPPTEADAEAIHGLIAAVQRSRIGRVDYTLEEVQDDLRSPDGDLSRDTWLVLGADGAAVGWAWAWPTGDGGIVDVDVFTLDGEVADWLWAAVRARAAEIGRERGWPSVTVAAGVYREDAATGRRLAGYGFEVGTVYHRLRIAHTGRRALPDVPPGYVLKNGAESERVRRDAHATREAAFHDHYGHVRREFDGWVANLEAGSTHDWSFLNVLYTESGEPAGLTLRSTQFVPDEKCGYLRLLGVHPAFQGRGLGRWLLRHAFAEDARDGWSGTILHVDTDPRRPALGLYLSEGMRVVQIIDAWRRVM
ncbi:GNAT family N-acetyltransferase [Catenuloplanes atrovinosus]|uniref:GNAT superfamily N-acetyltransferase n=1 Tax=Catenuloplanes atrovinosus TaxID=137266 RepID=A0AAE3YJ29_9ACTN|nr:GNAT family N-acetyltransferase [Catenuloplanes atrovinosus]MDR7274763.1 GNAT superfamily N-acetyltransferase [Catenuloplanes atrovinosus]